MRYLLTAMGSHGDVHPFIGIAQALQRRGHDVAVAAQAYFAPLIEAAGVDAVPLGEPGDYERLASNPDLWHARRGAPVIWQTILETLPTAYEGLADAATENTIVVASTLAWAGLMLAEKRGLRCASVHLQPVVFYSTHAMPRLPGVPRIVRLLPRPLLERFYAGADQFVLDPKIAPGLNDFRAGLGLEPVSRIMRQFIHADDLAIGMWPDWYAPPQPDWPGQTKLAGFPLYDEADVTPLPEDVSTFLDAGPPPVAFTPGSAMIHGRRFFQTAVDACRRADLRGLLLTRHAEQIPADLPSEVIHVPYAPFSKLLPRCGALIFHGGIGTASQALAAGVPTVVMPMAHDQFDNAERLARLGTSATLSVRRFNPRRVACVLEDHIHDPAVRAACHKAQQQLAAHDGCTAAAVHLEALVSSS